MLDSFALNDLAFLSAASMEGACSIAFVSVSVFSVSSHRRIASLRIPHTKRSRRACSK